MERQELNNYSKYKWISPFCHTIAILAIVCGPFLFPIIYWKLNLLIFIYGFLRLIYMFVCGLIIIYKAVNVKNFSREDNPTDYYYTWIIPSYMESADIISATLQQLAKHWRSKSNYIICLGMQAHEVGSSEKAKALCQKFRNSFKYITYSVHTIANNQAKGKATNVSFAVQSFEKILPTWVDFSKLVLTIIDCDSMCPAEYIDQVNAHFFRNPKEFNNLVFNPTQIFKRNDANVPILTRSFDNYHSFGHCNNTVSFFNFSSPFSNYSLSYNLIKEVGFWDKNGQALGEDMHTFSKIFWKTEGRVKSIPIYTPFNQLNLEQPDSYISNMVGKWNQTLRHSYGIHEVSYNIFQFSNAKNKTLRGFCYVFYFIDIMLIHNCFTIPMLLIHQLTNLIGNVNSSTFKQQEILQLLGLLSGILNILCLITYEIFKRYTNKRYYKGENQSYLRFFQYFVFLIFGIYGIIYPTFFIASFKGYFKNLQYKVASKKIKMVNKLQ